MRVETNDVVSEMTVSHGRGVAEEFTQRVWRGGYGDTGHIGGCDEVLKAANKREVFTGSCANDRDYLTHIHM